ncbi:MAG TPA: hypothetical protein VKB96_12815 [Gammaproteobacteria bacterium]|nr:hypothetical protein [Gammaproteobacteria bacterium]
MPNRNVRMVGGLMPIMETVPTLATACTANPAPAKVRRQASRDRLAQWSAAGWR